MSEDLFSVLAAIGIIALVYRWFTTSPTTTTTSNGGTNSAGSLTTLQRRAMSLPRAQIDRLLTMFPQLTENEVRYALVVNRGGVEAVAERVLIRGGLEPPPPNFFPQSSSTTDSTSNNNTSSSSSSGTATTTTTSNQSIKTNQTLITKFNLEPYKIDQDKLFNSNQDWSWEDSKSRLNSDLTSSLGEQDNASTLHERKSKMVLESRWKILQKDKKGKSIAP
ncbi:hypothetical protein MJO28_014194 [Puccinia striiformis f. sp. tritici]|uniref:CUE domain-containing protein n=2 Tax=Puccinia striiformis f. sp. tritici TaxID=168172 RepID=A0A0L0W453_9BASI|nr:hypothetical protein Pst134EA_026663 [Puccinia striiformis f. sp. tritici]KAI9616398.1 hypothetical protein H4Q26_010790 [Puccinia striiformis f. sp. tritici PST-130]KNF06291.1 hypothetical protein PSTG_00797 [Puccinia striiformis f. sp. tritici PST-78]KAH9442869.1 hypothetical protein Pst134EB_027222 [Puccinia striiformis f. sp. tritici]KAH9449950.1 hypothetical protein Pst134EA_026663 [Puccinia striiformis f. sp. tritici]KAI7938615.1 hypothetical protein MJO28_014194 [Puccinia striiformis